MNLIIDIGNSKVKIAVYSKSAIIFSTTRKHNQLYETVFEILDKFKNINKCILSAVGKLPTALLNVLPKTITKVELSYTLNFPFNNHYKTPQTLGVDRLALVSAAVVLYPNENVLIIDAGTCITYDFVDAKSNYFGGAISPGLTMRYKALHNQTEKLPLLKPKSITSVIGQSTKECIHSGVINGLIYEIEGVLTYYRSKYHDFTIILTGGDSKFLSKRLKNSIFADSNFLLEGLNHILEYNT